jgi:hypothetical protein
LSPPRSQICCCPGAEEGGAARAAGGGDTERASSQQHALTTAGDFFLQRAFSQHLSWIFPPLAERQKRVGPSLCSSSSSIGGSGGGCSAQSPLEVTTSKPCSVAGCDQRPEERRIEPVGRSYPALPLRHGLNPQPPCFESPRSTWVCAPPQQPQGGARHRRPRPGTPGRRASHPFMPSAAALLKAFAAGNRGTSQSQSLRQLSLGAP